MRDRTSGKVQRRAPALPQPTCPPGCMSGAARQDESTPALLYRERLIMSCPQSFTEASQSPERPSPCTQAMSGTMLYRASSPYGAARGRLW